MPKDTKSSSSGITMKQKLPLYGDTQNKPKPSDLGTGGARKAADAIINRKKLLDQY